MSQLVFVSFYVLRTNGRILSTNYRKPTIFTEIVVVVFLKVVSKQLIVCKSSQKNNIYYIIIKFHFLFIKIFLEPTTELITEILDLQR